MQDFTVQSIPPGNRKGAEVKAAKTPSSKSHISGRFRAWSIHTLNGRGDFKHPICLKGYSKTPLQEGLQLFPPFPIRGWILLSGRVRGPCYWGHFPNPWNQQLVAYGYVVSDIQTSANLTEKKIGAGIQILGIKRTQIRAVLPKGRGKDRFYMGYFIVESGTMNRGVGWLTSPLI